MMTIALETWSFVAAFREAGASRGELGWLEYYQTTKSAELPVILLEDLREAVPSARYIYIEPDLPRGAATS